ncbi:MAG: hypothetical protein AVDCRST_MAG75-2473, partial [uncultured Propionibacteriaceae bacterium]
GDSRTRCAGLILGYWSRHTPSVVQLDNDDVRSDHLVAETGRGGDRSL